MMPNLYICEVEDQCTTSNQLDVAAAGLSGSFTRPTSSRLQAYAAGRSLHDIASMGRREMEIPREQEHPDGNQLHHRCQYPTATIDRASHREIELVGCELKNNT